LHESIDRLQPKLLASGRIGGIKTGRLHSGAAVTAGAGQWPHDVEKESISRKALQDFLHMWLEKCFDVRGVETQITVEASLKWRGALERADATRFIQREPLRVLAGSVVIPLHGGINWDANIVGVAGIDLRLEQVGGKMRMSSLWI
jgi:hypothetical protein